MKRIFFFIPGSGCYRLRSAPGCESLQDKSSGDHKLARQKEHCFGDPGERADSKPGEQERQIRRYGNHRRRRIEILPHDSVQGVRSPAVIKLLPEKAGRCHGVVVIDAEIADERAPPASTQYAIVQSTFLTTGPPKTLIESSRPTDHIRAVGDIIRRQEAGSVR
jgi:hypothetical protein